jgi:hypothetical protein
MAVLLRAWYWRVDLVKTVSHSFSAIQPAMSASIPGIPRSPTAPGIQNFRDSRVKDESVAVVGVVYSLHRQEKPFNMLQLRL